MIALQENINFQVLILVLDAHPHCSICTQFVAHLRCSNLLLLSCSLYLTGLHSKETIRRVFSMYRKVSSGCDGSTGFGFNGCLNVTSLFHLFLAIDLHGKNIVDLGAGEGRVMASALKYGAKSVIGYELPANSAHKFIYNAVLLRIWGSVSPDSQTHSKDIDQVLCLVNSFSY